MSGGTSTIMDWLGPLLEAAELDKAKVAAAAQWVAEVGAVRSDLLDDAEARVELAERLQLRKYEAKRFCRMLDSCRSGLGPQDQDNLTKAVSALSNSGGTAWHANRHVMTDPSMLEGAVGSRDLDILIHHATLLSTGLASLQKRVAGCNVCQSTVSQTMVHIGQARPAAPEHLTSTNFIEGLDRRMHELVMLHLPTYDLLHSCFALSRCCADVLGEPFFWDKRRPLKWLLDLKTSGSIEQGRLQTLSADRACTWAPAPWFLEDVEYGWEDTPWPGYSDECERNAASFEILRQQVSHMRWSDTPNLSRGGPMPNVHLAPTVCCIRLYQTHTYKELCLFISSRVAGAQGKWVEMQYIYNGLEGKCYMRWCVGGHGEDFFSKPLVNWEGKGLGSWAWIPWGEGEYDRHFIFIGEPIRANKAGCCSSSEFKDLSDYLGIRDSQTVWKLLSEASCHFAQANGLNIEDCRSCLVLGSGSS